MGAVTMCSPARGVAGRAAAAGADATGAGIGAAVIAAGGGAVVAYTGCWLGSTRAMRRVSSPSLISISAMPDSSSSSIIFLIFRISMTEGSGLMALALAQFAGAGGGIACADYVKLRSLSCCRPGQILPRIRVENVPKLQRFA